MTPEQANRLMGLIALREAQDALEHAAGWIVLVTHRDAPERVLGAYGPYQEPAAALAAAAEQAAELNQDADEDGFRCRTYPLSDVT